MRVLNADCVLHRPFVDGLRGMGHVDTAGEVGLREDVGEGGGMVHVVAGLLLALSSEVYRSYIDAVAEGLAVAVAASMEKEVQVVKSRVAYGCYVDCHDAAGAFGSQQSKLCFLHALRHVVIATGEGGI